jgi:glucuronoarabinoxylan endo-1,4-beta-xylanase
MDFRRLLIVVGLAVLTLAIGFFLGCEKSQSTSPELEEIKNQEIAKTREDCSVDLGSVRQTIRGFGGMNFPRWINDLSSSQVDKAFGTGSGQIGLTILRISVPPNENDWSGEVSTPQRAKSHGAIVLATPWSPPASMKTNNSTIGGSLNSSSYGAYANHLRDFCNYMSNNGASLYAISVQNEPDYVPNYESCGWSASQMRTFLNNNASVIPVRVVAPETVYPKSDWYNTLSSSSEVDIYADHLYGGSPTSFSKEHWMTEHYTNSSISGNAWPEALDAGAEISNCMTNGYNAYIWWYIRRSYGLLDESGNVTKRGYVMSHFSKFVRPGYTRINATHQPASDVYVTAYKNGSDVVIVAINRNSSSRSITFNFSGRQVNSFTKYETTSNSNVSNRGSVSGGNSMTNSLAAYSISTFVSTTGGGSITSTTTTTSGGTTTTTSGVTTTTTTSGWWWGSTTTSGDTTTTTSGSTWWGGDSWWGSSTTTTTSGGYTTTTTNGRSWWGGGSWW